jgi:uncharacterized DUF497 family protein
MDYKCGQIVQFIAASWPCSARNVGRGALGNAGLPSPVRSPLALFLISRYDLDVLRFDWDERKNKSNRAKHGLWFEEAQSVFDDPHARLFYDPEHSEEENRFILLGVSLAERTLVVVHCYREADSLVRIISARKATKGEVRVYEERI